MELLIGTTFGLLFFASFLYHQHIEWQKVSTVEKDRQNEREVNMIRANNIAKIKEEELQANIKRAENEQKFYQDKLNENTESINKLVDTITKQYEISTELQLHGSNHVVQPSLSNDVYTRMEVMRFCKNEMGVRSNRELKECIVQTVKGEFFTDDNIEENSNDNDNNIINIINNEGKEIISKNKNQNHNSDLDDNTENGSENNYNFFASEVNSY